MKPTWKSEEQKWMKNKKKRKTDQSLAIGVKSEEQKQFLDQLGQQNDPYPPEKGKNKNERKEEEKKHWPISGHRSEAWRTETVSGSAWTTKTGW